MSFFSREVLPGVHHIQDAMGVCMTLLTGTESALLIDTGYGIENVQAFVRSITDLPLTVMITHGHHDHCMGVKWFDTTWMFPQDQQDFITYTGRATRQRIVDSALQKGIEFDAEAYLSAQVSMPRKLKEQVVALGGLSVQIMHCPGHTPGSFVAYVPEHQLLLTGDDWNPCTWLFFPAALDLFTYRRHMDQVMKLPFTYVLCSHQPVLFERAKMEAFMQGLSGLSLDEPEFVTIPPYVDIHTAQYAPAEGQIIVYDYDKAMSMRSGG